MSRAGAVSIASDSVPKHLDGRRPGLGGNVRAWPEAKSIRYSDRTAVGVLVSPVFGPDSGPWKQVPIGALDSCGQATKGTWGMSWRQEALKGVEDCDKPGGVVKRALIPGFLNSHALNPIDACGKRGELKHLSNRRKRKKPRFPE